jgi:acetyl esterase
MQGVSRSDRGRRRGGRCTQMSAVEARANAMPPELGGPEQPVHRWRTAAFPATAASFPCASTTVRNRAAARPGVLSRRRVRAGGLDGSDRTCRALANGSGCVVISVDYRLAPEHTFPAAADDAFAVTQYVSEHAAEFGVDPALLAVGGDSAGGNLATVVALARARRRRAADRVSAAGLSVVDFTDDSPSAREFAADHFLTAEAMAWFADYYLPPPIDRRQPWVSPMHAKLEGLPPAFVLTAECDPLRDQGEAYARRLQAAGVQTSMKRYDGMFHPFFSLAGIIDGAKTAMADASAALKTALTAVAV